jgi:hypothetical protein
MLINRDDIFYTSMTEERRKKNPEHVFGFKKKAKIYLLRLSFGGAPEPLEGVGRA